MTQRAEPIPRGLSIPVPSFGRFRVLFRQKRFWVVQLLMGLVTAFHGLVEFFGGEERGGFLGALSYLPVELYVLPIVLAAYWYGLEGAMMTGILATVLSVPNLVLFHRAEFAWLGEAFANTTVLGFGLVVGLMVERAQRERAKAEATSARLRVLQQVTEVLNRYEAPEDLTRAVLHALVAVPGAESAAFVPTTVSVGGGPGGLAELPVAPLEMAVGDDSAAGLVARAPVEVGGAPIGELVVRHRATGDDGGEERRLVEHVAAELSLAVEHALIREGTRLGLKNYARAVTVAQESERRRIARDLHDGPAQSLVVLARGLRRISEASAAQRSRGEADHLTALAQETLRSIRETIGGLRPSLLDDLGLVAALESLTSAHDTSPNPNVAFVVVGEPRRLEGPLEVAAYRIAQEALANAMNHGRGERIDVVLEFGPGALELAISDDGPGFEDESVVPGSFGLTGMRERAELVGGSLAVESSPAGTTVRFIAPG